VSDIKLKILREAATPIVEMWESGELDAHWVQDRPKIILALSKLKAALNQTSD
jgi:hypothetical protein